MLLPALFCLNNDRFKFSNRTSLIIFRFHSEKRLKFDTAFLLHSIILVLIFSSCLLDLQFSFDFSGKFFGNYEWPVCGVGMSNDMSSIVVRAGQSLWLCASLFEWLINLIRTWLSKHARWMTALQPILVQWKQSVCLESSGNSCRNSLLSKSYSINQPSEVMPKWPS